MLIHFISFSAGNEKLRMAGKRIQKEASESNYFDEIHVCDEQTHYPVLKNFLESNDFILKSRGFGYWAWKPHLILDVFNKAKNGDVICYADAGCQISSVALDKFNENILICKRNKSLFYHMPKILEKYYTKYKLLEYFDYNNEQEILKAPQVQATYFYLEVCAENLELVKKWAKISKLENFSYIDDSDSYGFDNTFIEHRHDQSILSLLVKETELKTYPTEDNFNLSDYYINSPIMLYPIHTLRNRTGTQKYQLAFKYSSKKIQSKSFIFKFINALFYLFQKIINRMQFLRNIFEISINKINKTKTLEKYINKK